MRVKLIFAKDLAQGELSKCLFPVPLKSQGGSLQTISDFAHVIETSFQLRKLCPFGVVLSVGGFVLPPGQDVDLVRDNDEIWSEELLFWGVAA